MATTTSLILLVALAGSGGTPQTPAQAPQTAPAPQGKTFTDPALGLSFVLPPTWTSVPTPVPVAPAGKGNRFKLPGGKKPQTRPDEGMATFRIPTADGAPPAELTIVRASFSGPPETWQQIQSDTNRNLKREVAQQWQQEILGVPLLLTKINYSQDGAAQTTLTGLLYNASAYKLLFRLTGPTSNFDAAQFEFTKAMESLRTTNDTLPVAQDPDHPIAPPPDATAPDAKHTLFTRPKADPRIAPVTLAVTVGERKMVLRVPEGWTMEKVEGDAATLRNPGLKNPVTVKLYAAATASRPTDALTAAANGTLAEYKKVDLREDTPGVPNKAGNPVLAVWRRGDGAKGPLATLDAVAVAGDYYLLFAFRPTPGAAMGGERRTVQAMLDRVGLEPAP